MVNKISAKVLAQTMNTENGNILTTFEVVFPRIILAEVLTHRAFSRNTSSSRAMPFQKVIDMVENNPFIPMAYQKCHNGMQGNDYLKDKDDIEEAELTWLGARDTALEQAKLLHAGCDVTKQLCNRLLEPFMWVKMIITSDFDGLSNFFNLRCPEYTVNDTDLIFKCKRDCINHLKTIGAEETRENFNTLQWLLWNKGQAEIHIMELAEAMYVAFTDAEPTKKALGEWHVPYFDEIKPVVDKYVNEQTDLGKGEGLSYYELYHKVSVAQCARVSFTAFDDNGIDVEKDLALFEKLKNNRHLSPFEHVNYITSVSKDFDLMREGFISMREAL